MNEEKETKLEKLEKSAEQLKVEFYQDQFGNTVAEIGKDGNDDKRRHIQTKTIGLLTDNQFCNTKTETTNKEI